MTASAANIINQYQGVAPNRVLRAVEVASARTGTDFSFLMQKAQTESNFNATAKAKTSSATGLYQFIENTWLTMVKKHGEKYGLGDMADKITINNAGKACVADCEAKKEILALRNSPEVSALMAGEFSAENKEYLEERTSGEVGATEMYLAHFMGAGGAAKFLNAREDNGAAKAASLFPAAAQANKNVFYDKSGNARSLDQVYSIFDRKFSDTSITDGAASSPKRTAGSSPDFAATCAVDTPVSAYATQIAAFSPEAAIGDMLTQASSSAKSAKTAKKDDGIVWFDEEPAARKASSAKSVSSHSHIASALSSQKLSPASMMTILEMQSPAFAEAKRNSRYPTYNS